ncbi:hypothetical protein DFH28DRAFT_498549 [Melampsora americana]|nr:hypothetical protein DFH28DRAFT_498549 [Melampsora americana]
MSAPKTTIAERRRSSVRFTDEEALPTFISIPQVTTEGRSTRGRPPTPAASKVTEAYFASSSESNTANEDDDNQSIYHESQWTDGEDLSPRSQPPTAGMDTRPDFLNTPVIASAPPSVVIPIPPQAHSSVPSYQPYSTNQPKQDALTSTMSPLQPNFATYSNLSPHRSNFSPQVPNFQTTIPSQGSATPFLSQASVCSPYHPAFQASSLAQVQPHSPEKGRFIQAGAPRHHSIHDILPGHLNYPDLAYQSVVHQHRNSAPHIYPTDFSTLPKPDSAASANLEWRCPMPAPLLQSQATNDTFHMRHHGMYDPSEGLEALREERRRGSEDTLVGRGDIEASPKKGSFPSIETAGNIAGRDPQHRTSQPLKPSLRRSTTEDIVNHQPVMNAASIVDSHVHRRRGQKVGHHEEEQHHNSANENELSNLKGGVLSHLLELYGAGGPVERSSSATSGTTAAESVATSRVTSNDSRIIRRKTTGRPSSRRGDSPEFASDIFSTHEGAEKHERSKHHSGRRPSLHRRKSRTSDGGESDGGSVRSARSVMTFRTIVDQVQDRIHSRKAKTRERRASITMHVADILKRQDFILKLAKALMATGAPSHRLESQLSATARVLEIDAQFVHLPSIVIATFGDCDTRTSETHFVKAVGDIALGQLHRVHEIYKSVVHDQTGVGEGSAALHRILNEDPIYTVWQRMIIAAFCCGIISMLGFAGSFVDAWVSAAFGSFLAFMQLRATKNQMYSNIFEISIATLVSFVARGLSTTQFFCYESLSSAGVVLILPGYTILCGSLELASKNLIAGSVRMVYAVIYSLFLGFGISIGSDFYYLLDPNARRIAAMHATSQSYSLAGSFSGLNGTLPVMDGKFTLTNSSAGTNDALLKQGNIQCYRNPEWEWWRQSINPWWMFLLVPAFSFFLSLWNLQPLRSKQMPVMVIIACSGWVCNYFANQFIFDRSDVVSFLGAFAIGLMGNMYSRVFKGTAFTSMVTGVLFLVPSGIAAAGGLAMTYHSNSGDSYSNGLVIGFRMVQVAIGITVGLFFSSFVVYSFGRGKSSAAFTF